MNKKSTLYLVTAVLLVEAVVIVALPSRIPRSARALTAATNLIVVAAIWVFARQSPSK